MSLREEADRSGAERIAGARRSPIDFEHLRRETLGNAKLERQTLSLFARQASAYVAKVKTAPTLEERSVAARMLAGLAEGVGAFSIAYIAKEIEISRAPVIGQLIALDRAIEAARQVITGHLGE